MALIKRIKGQVLNLVKRTGFNEFNFTDESGNGTAFDHVDVSGSLVRGTGRDFTLFASATADTEILLIINPVEGVDDFSNTNKVIRFPIKADQSIQVEFKNILLESFYIDFNGDYSGGTSNLDTIVITVV